MLIMAFIRTTSVWGSHLVGKISMVEENEWQLMLGPSSHLCFVLGLGKFKLSCGFFVPLPSLRTRLKVGSPQSILLLWEIHLDGERNFIFLPQQHKTKEILTSCFYHTHATKGIWLLVALCCFSFPYLSLGPFLTSSLYSEPQVSEHTSGFFCFWGSVGWQRW